MKIALFCGAVSLALAGRLAILLWRDWKQLNEEENYDPENR